MNYFKSYAIILMLAILASCQKSESPIDTDNQDSQTNSFFQVPDETLGNSKLEGVVTDQEGLPMINVTVQFGSEKTTTNSQGYYFINKVSEGEDKPIYFLKDGYMMNQKLASISEERVSRIDAALYPVEIEEDITPDGAKLVYEDFEIEIPEGAYSEEVTVKATAYRVSDDNFTNAFPGDFEGERTDNSIVPIESFGFMNVEVSNNKGYVDPNLPVTLKIKATNDAPASIPMWYYDFKAKKWVEEGSWTLVDGYFIGEVNHFTPWNVDIPRDPPTSEIFGRVVDQTGKPLENALVQLNGETTRFARQAYTDVDGKFSITTLENTEFLIEASWSFYYPTMITKTSSGDDNSQVDAGDIIIDVSDENEAEPLITETLLEMMPGESFILRGNYFGNQFRVNYKVLIDGIPVEVIRNWSNNEIQFTVPSWISLNGVVQILRGNSESNEVEYEIPNEFWTIYPFNQNDVPLAMVQTVPSIIENNDNIVYFGTHGNGVISFDDSEFDSFVDFNQIGNIESVFINSENQLWVASSIGLFVSEDHINFIRINNAESSLVNCYSITEDQEGNIWIASIENGFFKIDKNRNIEHYTTVNSNLTSNSIRKVYYSGNTNSIWIGTRGGGLLEFDGNNFTIFNTSNSNIPDNTIYDIIEDIEGELWLGTQRGGIAKFENGQFQIWNSSNSDLPSDDVPRISLASNGGLWIGTWGGGLVRFDKSQTFEIWDTSNSEINGNLVHSLIEASDGTVWVGIYGAGIAKLNFRNINQ